MCRRILPYLCSVAGGIPPRVHSVAVHRPRRPFTRTGASEAWERRIEGDHLAYKKTVTLRTIANRVGLTPCTISSILNNAPASRSIPQKTKDRVLRATAELNYRPNLSARSLRTKRTYMVAVVGADLAHVSLARVVAGMERQLRLRGYLLVLGTFGCTAEWINLSAEFQQRGIDGVVSIGTTLPRDPECPVVSVDLGGLLGNVEDRDLLSGEACNRLTALGESAADAVLWMIERKGATPIRKGATSTNRVAAEPPQPCFGVPRAGLGGQAISPMGD